MGRPKATPDQERKSLITMKGPQAWCDWANGLSDHVGLPLSEVLDMGLQEVAKKFKYPAGHPGRKIPAQGPSKKKAAPKLEEEPTP